jgi:hypothetical protein
MLAEELIEASANFPVESRPSRPQALDGVVRADD